jgi:hypothetical protein
MKIRSRRAHAAPEKPPKPAAAPIMPLGSCIDPRVLAYAAIQWFALSSHEVPLPTKPRGIQSAPATISSILLKTPPAVLSYADVLAHGSLWFQNRLATIMAVVWAILPPVLVLARRRLVEESSDAPAGRASPVAGKNQAVISHLLEVLAARNHARGEEMPFSASLPIIPQAHNYHVTSPTEERGAGRVARSNQLSCICAPKRRPWIKIQLTSGTPNCR